MVPESTYRLLNGLLCVPKSYELALSGTICVSISICPEPFVDICSVRDERLFNSVWTFTETSLINANLLLDTSTYSLFVSSYTRISSDFILNLAIEPSVELYKFSELSFRIFTEPPLTSKNPWT